MTRAEAEHYTASLYRIIQRDFWGPAALATRSAPPSAH